LPPIRIIDRGAARFCAFRKHCAACHTINGEGGGKAPELNYPAGVVEYIRPGYLKRWIKRPQSICYNTTAPGLADGIISREKIRKNSLLSQSDEHHEA
jgi:mono/diheme cytochrome c family protein